MASTRPRQLRSAQTETALKAAARRVFARQGYLNAKISDITAEAGRAVGSFYSYFDSKEDLLEALLADFHSDFERRAGQPAEAGLPPLRDLVRAYWTAYREHLPEMVAIFQASMVDAAFARRWRDLHAPFLAEACRQDAARRDGTGPIAPRSRLIATALISMMEHFCYVWLAGGGAPPDVDLDDDEIIDTLTDLIEHGIGSDAGPAAAGPASSHR